jgi:hypothetical protein
MEKGSSRHSWCGARRWQWLCSSSFSLNPGRGRRRRRRRRRRRTRFYPLLSGTDRNSFNCRRQIHRRRRAVMLQRGQSRPLQRRVCCRRRRRLGRCSSPRAGRGGSEAPGRMGLRVARVNFQSRHPKSGLCPGPSLVFPTSSTRQLRMGLLAFRANSVAQVAPTAPCRLTLCPEDGTKENILGKLQKQLWAAERTQGRRTEKRQVRGSRGGRGTTPAARRSSESKMPLPQAAVFR